jgi:hypothetical protein
MHHRSASLFAFLVQHVGVAPIVAAHGEGGHVLQHFMLTHNLLLPAADQIGGMLLMGAGCNHEPCATKQTFA